MSSTYARTPGVHQFGCKRHKPTEQPQRDLSPAEAWEHWRRCSARSAEAHGRYLQTGSDADFDAWIQCINAASHAWEIVKRDGAITGADETNLEEESDDGG
jgi:hypothetical protein